MEIQWYPGHMKRALREIQENIKLIDIVVEILDARIPMASKNPDIDNLAKDKTRVVILNKKDLAQDDKTNEWVDYFREQGYFCIATDARNSSSFKEVNKLIQEAGEKKRERDRKRGIKNRPLRLLIAGIPNSGKSTFINSFSKKASTKTGDKPGVTKGKQWINISKDAQMLDTPGILWPKFEDKEIGLDLAICKSIRDEILNEEELAFYLLSKLFVICPDTIRKVYGIVFEDAESAIEEITKARNYLLPGAAPDIKRGANALLDDFRNGRIGKITLEDRMEWTNGRE